MEMYWLSASRRVPKAKWMQDLMFRLTFPFRVCFTPATGKHRTRRLLENNEGQFQRKNL